MYIYFKKEKVKGKRTKLIWFIVYIKCRETIKNFKCTYH